MKFSGLSTWLRTFTTSPFQPWWIQALPETMFWTSSVEKPRIFGLRPSAHSFAFSTSASSVELRLGAVDEVAGADDLLEVVEQVGAAVGGGLPMSFHEPAMSLILSAR